MKKLLIASAALAMVAGTVQAQSTVTVYGILDMGYVAESKKAQSATATTDVTGINTGAGLSGNRIGFRGTEDLGGGLTAGFVYELGITPENSTTLHSTRQALLSISSKTLGSLNMGRGNTLGKNTNDGFTAFGGGGSFEQGSVTLEITRGDEVAASGTAAKNIKAAFDRVSNQATYTSPSFSGVTFSAQLVSKNSDSDAINGEASQGRGVSSAGAAADVAGPRGTAFQVAYAGKGFTAAYTRTDYETETEAATPAITETKADQFGATYTMGGLKVFGLYNTAKYKASATAAEDQNKGFDIGATYTMGNTTLLASIGDGEIKTAAGATTDVKGMQAQIRYALSKRTTAYALYGKTEFENATTGESDVTMIGVRHTF
jgi:predicted porin